jgi:hypothetical protein
MCLKSVFLLNISTGMFIRIQYTESYYTLYAVLGLFSDSLVCPYTRCGRPFEKPVMVTDYSRLPRETYYACPHCMLRLELLLDNGAQDDLGCVHVRPHSGTIPCLEGVKENRCPGEAVSNFQATRPTKACRHFLGYLRSQPEDSDIPDECAICPSIVVCYVRKE